MNGGLLNVMAGEGYNIISWLNSFLPCDTVKSLEELANGKYLCILATNVNSTKWEYENREDKNVIEKRFAYIKEAINNHYHVDSNKLIDFHLLQNGKISEIIKASLLLMSAIVIHLYTESNYSLLNPLHDLPISSQVYIRDCLELILAADDESKLSTALSKMSSFASDEGLSSPRKTRNQSQASPLSQESNNVPSALFTTPVLKKHRNIRNKNHQFVSPLKIFIESPSLKHQIHMKEKLQEIAGLRKRLNDEEGRSFELDQKYSTLSLEVHNKDEEIKELKEKINFLRPFHDKVEECEQAKLELEEKIAVLEEKYKNCEKCTLLENEIRSLENEILQLQDSNEDNAEKKKKTKVQIESLANENRQKNLEIMALKIEISENQGKNEVLVQQVEQLKSCLDLYKRKCSEENSLKQKYFAEPFNCFRTSLKSDEETLKGIVDKKNQELEEELEQRNCQMQELVGKLKELKVWSDCNDELNTSACCLDDPFANSSFVTCHERGTSISMKSVIKRLESFIADLKCQLSNAEQKLVNVTEEHSTCSVKYSELAAELAHSNEKYEISIKEKEILEEELNEEISQQKRNIESMSSQMNSLKEHILTLQKEHEIVREERDRNVETIEELDGKLFEKTNFCDKITEEFERQIQELNSEIMELKVNYEYALREKDDYVVEMQQLKEELAEKMEFHGKQIQDYELQTEELKKQITNSEKSLKQIQAEKDESTTQLKHMEKEYSEKIFLYEKEIQSYNFQIETFNEKIKKLEEDIEANEKEKDKHSVLVGQLEKELAEKESLYKKEINGYQLEIEKLNNGIIDAEKNIEHIQKERDNNLEEVQSLKEELLEKSVSHNKETEDYKLCIEKLKEEILNLKENCKSIQGEKNDSDAKIINLEQQENLHRQEIEGCKSQISYLNNEIEKLERESESAKLQILNRVSEISQLEQDLAENKLSHETEIKEYKLCIEKLNEKTSSLEKNNLNIRRMNDEHITKIEQLEHEVVQKTDSHKADIEFYESKLSNLSTEIKLLEKNYTLVQEEKNSEYEKARQLEKKLLENTSSHVVEINAYEMQLEEMKVKFKDIEKKYEDEKQESEINTMKIRLLEKKLYESEKAHEKDVSSCKLQIERLKAMWQRIRVMKDQETEELTKLEKKNQVLSAEHELLKQSYQDAQSKISSLGWATYKHLHCNEASTSKNSERLDNKNKEKIAELENQNKLLLDQIEALKEKYNLFKEKQFTKELMQNQISHYESTIEEQKLGINELQEKINELQQKNGEEVKLLLSEIEILKKQKLNDAQSFHQLEIKNKETLDELNILKQNYETELSTKHLSEKHMNENLSHKEETIERQNKIILEHDEIMRISKENNENMRKEYENLNMKHTALQNENHELSDRLEKFKQERISHVTALTTVNNEGKKLLDEFYSSLKNQKENTESVNLSQDPIPLIAEFKKCLKSLKQINNELQRDLEIGHKKQIELEDNKTQLHSELEQLKINFEQTSSRDEMMKEEMKEQLNCQLKTIEDIKLAISELNEKFDAAKIFGDMYIQNEMPRAIDLGESKISVELKELNFKCQNCIKENERLNEVCDQKDKEISDLKSHILKNCEEMEEIKIHLTEKENALCETAEKLELAEKKILEIKEESERNFLCQLQNLESEKDNKINQLTQEKDEIVKSLEILKQNSKAELEKKNEELKKMQHHLDTYKSIAKSATEDIKMLKEKARSIHKKDGLESMQFATKYIKAKELVNELKEENEELKKNLELNAKLTSEKEALKEKNRALKAELEASRQSVIPLRTRIKVIEKALHKKEEENKDLHGQLKIAKSEIKNLKEAVEKHEYELQRRLSFCSSVDLYDFKSSPSLRLRSHGLQGRNSTYIKDDMFKKPSVEINSVPNTPGFNRSSSSSTSGGFNKSILGGTGHFHCADEEEYLLHSSLENIGPSHSNTLKIDDRLNELQRRNTLCPPHMRSSYPVETQVQSPSKFSDSALKAGRAVKEKSPKRKFNRSSSFTDLTEKPPKKPGFATRKSSRLFRSVRETPNSYSPFLPGRTDSSIKRLYLRMKRSKPTPPRK